MMGNMYEGVKTWNPLAGRCGHECIYCSTHTLRRQYKACDAKYSGPYRIVEAEIQTRQPSKKLVFVCGQNDLFADGVPSAMIRRVLEWTRNHDNEYMFQTKNPGRFYEFLQQFPRNKWLGTTLETNRNTIKICNAPSPRERTLQFSNLMCTRKYVTIEPIMDFDHTEFLQMIDLIEPDKIYIGADSKHNHLSEPTPERIGNLIRSLKQMGYAVELKSNLKRLYYATSHPTPAQEPSQRAGHE